jgi:hypothetical protein
MPMWTLNGYKMLYTVTYVTWYLQCLSNSQFYATWNSQLFHLVSFVANLYSGWNVRLIHIYVVHSVTCSAIEVLSHPMEF